MIVNGCFQRIYPNGYLERMFPNECLPKNVTKRMFSKNPSRRMLYKNRIREFAYQSQKKILEHNRPVLRLGTKDLPPNTIRKSKVAEKRTKPKDDLEYTVQNPEQRKEQTESEAFPKTTASSISWIQIPDEFDTTPATRPKTDGERTYAQVSEDGKGKTAPVQAPRRTQGKRKGGKREKGKKGTGSWGNQNNWYGPVKRFLHQHFP